MEMELGNGSLKHQGNRTRTYSGNNEFISEVIRTVSQIQTHRNLKNYHTLEMLWVFSRFYFIKSPGHHRNSWTLALEKQPGPHQATAGLLHHH